MSKGWLLSVFIVGTLVMLGVFIGLYNENSRVLAPDKSYSQLESR